MLEDETFAWLMELGIDLPFELHDCQKLALQEIMEDKGVLAIFPTGLGKTLIALFASLYSREIKQKKSMLMAPLRALTTEHVETYREYGLRPMIDNGEHPKDIRDYSKGDFDCVISTYEKMDSIIRNYNDYSEYQRRDIVFSQLDCIIIDEIHGIEDESRGVNLESFIMSVKFLYPHIKIVGLSATVGNYQEFADWLEIPVIYEPPKGRPVPLEINFIELYEYFAKQQFNEKMEHLYEHIENDPDAKRMIAVTAVNRTKQIVHALAGEDRWTKLKLGTFMRKFKMGWHYSGSKGMTEDERMAVEWAFQYEDLPEEEEYYYESEDRIINRMAWLWENFQLDHGINIIVCTPTLIVGRNLPVTYVDVFDYIQFTYTQGPVIIGANRMQQTIGRAGRQKFAKGDPDYKGVATIFTHVKDFPEVKRRATVPFTIVSHLIDHLGEKILAWINSKIVRHRKDIYSFLSNSLDPTIKNNDKLIEQELNFLFEYKFIAEDLRTQELTILDKGLKTVRYYIQPKSVVRWGALLAHYINNKDKKVKLNKFLAESMDIKEYYNSISVIKRDEPIIKQMIVHLDFPEISAQAIKSFVFCFPSYSLKLLNLQDNDYKIPEQESASMRKQFERMITAFSDIYGHTGFKKILDTSKYMVAAGIFNPKLARMMSVKGIGATYATRLYKAGVDSPQKMIDMYKSNRKKLLVITQMGATKLKKVINELLDPSQRGISKFGGKRG